MNFILKEMEMNKHIILFVLSAALIIFIIAGGMTACGDNSNKNRTYTFDVSGQVTDLTGKPLPNASIIFGTSTTSTDADGNYKVSFTQMNSIIAPPVKASAAGYEPANRNISNVPGTYDVNFVLNPVIDDAALAAAASSNVLGDIDGDKKVTILDALLAAKCANHQAVVPCNPKTADVNGNGTVDVIDALMISRYATGAITSFPKK
jgi:hypothetical protein